MNLLFDLDGTLTDPKPGISACVRHAMAGLGHPLPQAEDLDWLIGPPLQASFSLLLGSPTQVPKAMELYRERYQATGLYENRVYDDARSNKAELIRWILRQEELDPSKTWMIGDREHDLIGAKSNGLRGLGVAWGYGNREELIAAGALAVLEDPEELTRHLW